MERRLIDWLRERLPPHPLLRLGPGDDAAVLDAAGMDGCVVTTDLLSDGVDFVVGEVQPRLIGHKALAVNLSDLAAMAAEPIAAVVSLLLPRQGAYELATGLYEGMLPLAEQFHLAVAGGDTNTWPGRLAVSVTAIGRVTDRGPLRRDGAQPGDAIVVTGPLGGSILGRHLEPRPRIAEALELHRRFDLHAGIDCSDGLSVDLAHLADESGLGATIEAAAVPIHADAHRLAQQRGDGTSPLDHALSDGEDFELILAVPPADAQQIAAAGAGSVVGQFDQQGGLRIRDESGTITPLEPRGWEHGEEE